MKRIATLCLAFCSFYGQAQNETNSSALQTIGATETVAEISIEGRVLTADGEPAPFVTVQVQGLQKFAITTEDGNFQFRSLPEGNYTLLVSMSGMQTIGRSVTVGRNGPASIEVRLGINEKQLTEVIVASGRGGNDRTPSIGKAQIAPMDLPQAVTVLGPQVLRDQQAQRLSDAIRNVNGVYLTSTRGNVQESFSGRGYAFGSSNLFKNGAHINSGVVPEMGSLERVEVLKGSAAILFGQVAPGGIVNMVTKEPRFRKGGELSMRAGSYGLYKPSFDFYGPLSGKVAYRVNGSFESAASYRDKVHSEKYYVNPSLLFHFNKRTELLLEGDYLKHDFVPDFGIGTINNKEIPNVLRSAYYGTSWQYNHTQQATAAATLRHRLNENWSLSGGLNYQFYKRDYMAAERIQADANGNWKRSLGRISTEESYFTGQLNLTGNVKTGSWKHKILAGIDADHYTTEAFTFTFRGFSPSTPIYDTINLFDPAKYPLRTDVPEAQKAWKTVAPIDRFGIYVQDLVKLSDKFNVLAGIRASYVITNAIDSAYVPKDSARTGTARIDRALSPRLGLVYKPTTHTSLFASYSNSFTVNTGTDIYGVAVAPSLIDQFEAGVKNELLGGRLSANLTLYRIANNNLAQTAAYDRNGRINTNTAIKQLNGKTLSDGVELDLAGSPVEGLDIRGGYSYNYMRYTATDTTAGAFKAGERLVNNPAHTANLSSFFTVQKGRAKGLKLGASLLYMGQRFGGWNTDVVKVSGGAYTWRDRIFSVPGYTTLDLSAGYTWKKLSLMAKVSNVTNTLNWYVHENYSINPIPPTQLLATVTYRW